MTSLVRSEARSEYFPREDQSAQVNLRGPATDLLRAAPPALALAPYTPPPLDLLPPALQDYVEAAAVAVGIDTSFILLPLLSSLGAAAGDARVIRLKHGFLQPPIIWSAIIGPTGSKKSAAIEAGTFAMRNRERECIALNRAALVKHEKITAEWESKGKRERGTQPKLPPNLCCIANDLTLAALAWRLSENLHGILAVKDELSQFFGSFNQFDRGQGTDLAHYLSLHSGMLLAVDRKTGRESVRIFNPRVCIAGGIQPQVLGRCLSLEFFEQGLPARFLFAAPPPRPDRWTEATIPENVREAALRVFSNLFRLEPLKDKGETQPKPLPLDGDAKAAFVEFYNTVGADAIDADERGAAAWNKLTGYAARFALIGELARNADSERIEGEVMSAATELAGWFGREAERIYGGLVEPPDTVRLRRLIDFVARHGGEVTASDVAHSYRPLKGRPDQAESELCELVRAGLGEWTPVCTGLKGGKPTRRFRLLAGHSRCSCPRNPQKASGNGGIGDRYTMKTPPTEPTPEWASALPPDIDEYAAAEAKAQRDREALL